MAVKGGKPSDSEDDVIYGSKRNDRIYGDGGNDYLYGLAGNDELYGGTGNDWLYGGTGDDWLFGQEGDDHLFGEDGADKVIGGLGNDILDGGAGNDTLLGYEGVDQATGGSGGDIFEFTAAADSNAAQGIDTILDFNPGEGDFVELGLLHEGSDPFSLVSAATGTRNEATLEYDEATGLTTLNIYYGDGDVVADFTLILVGSHLDPASYHGIVG